MLLAICGLSAPGFWLGLMGIQYFSVHLGWFPVSGLDSWRSFILPSIVMGTGIMATLARYARSSMLEVLREDYVRTARAKGCAKVDVVWKHAFLNAALPIINSVGISFGAMLGGTVICESVFNMPGLGTVIIKAINSKDIPMVMGCTVLLSSIFCVIVLLVDIISAMVDPRVKAKLTN